MLSRNRLLLTSAFIALFAANVRAASLGFTMQSAPDIMSSFIDISYNAGAQHFDADGYAMSFDDDGVGPGINITGPQFFSIDASINNLGNDLSGSLIINGNVLSYGPSLLTASLSDFGWVDGGMDTFEFLFTVTGGGLAIPAYYGNPGSTFGVILTTAGSSFAGSWAVNFDNLGGNGPGFGEGVSDSAPLIPEPTSLALLVLGACVAGRRFRRSA